MILSVAITTKAGRALVSRQFHYLTRTQVEGHLGAFPKLLSASNQSYIETESIRYVYQDLGDLYFVLITTTDSNILEDLDLLALLVDLTRGVLRESGVTEQMVLENSLELIFAYDECVFDGYRQNLTVSQVVTFLAMDSVEEDEFNRRRIEKEKQAQQELRKRMTEIQAKKRLDKARPPAPGFSVEAVAQTAPVVTVPEAAPPPRRPPAGRSGMDLQRKTNARDRTQQMLLEEGLSAAAAHAAAPPPSTGFTIRLVETVSAKVTRHEQVREFRVDGRLIVSDVPAGVYAVQIRKGANFTRFAPRPMEQPNRHLFTDQSQLQFERDGTFLQWRSVDDSNCPLIVRGFTADPGKDPTTFSVGVELRDARFAEARAALVIPVANPATADVLAEFEDQVTRHQGDRVLRWAVPQLTAGVESVPLEFKVSRATDDSFYPIGVEFEADNLFCDIDVVAVGKIVNGVAEFDESVKCTVIKTLTQGAFEII